jgi:hypothetical protein
MNVSFLAWSHWWGRDNATAGMRHRGAPFVRYMGSTIVATDVRRRSLTVPRLDAGQASHYVGVPNGIPLGVAMRMEEISMFKRLIAIALAAALCGASASALAQSRGGGGGGHGGSGGGGWQGGGGSHGGGSWHGGGGNWHGGGGSWHGGNSNWRGGSNWHGGNNWHGGHWHGGRWYGGTSFVVGAPYFYWGWPYYYPYYYDPYYYAPAYTYYPAPNAVYLDSPSGDVQPYPGPSQRSTPRTQQYYCPDSGYYPSVQNCPKGWLRVVPEAVPEAPPAQ